jgi:hypothetical protein
LFWCIWTAGYQVESVLCKRQGVKKKTTLLEWTFDFFLMLASFLHFISLGHDGYLLDIMGKMKKKIVWELYA